jgi:hypothetical protein
MKALLVATLAWLFALNLFADLLPQRVLYIGDRASNFEPFLKQHFAEEKCVPLAAFDVSQAKDFDVVMLDWPQTAVTSPAWLGPCPLGKRDGWDKPTVLLGSAGLNLAVAWKLKGGSGCTCLAPVAYNLRDHLIFKSPMPVDIRATTNIPTPEPFSTELKTSTIPVLPLVDGIQQYQTVIRDYSPGWSTHYYEFADMPEVEVFSGGINEQTPRSAAFWRQGNLLHFGFQQSPSEMNPTGCAMLVNAIVYISHFSEDRPIDITPSVFGPEKIAVSRNRAKGYFARFPKEIPEIFTAATLASFNWRNATNAQDWFQSERSWIHPNSENLLEIDEQAKSFGVPFDSPEFLPQTIAALKDKKTKAIAETLLNRYVCQPLGPDAGADKWDQWYQENSPYVFYSELGGYRWYIDPLAKKRGIPTKDLRGPLRADADKKFAQAF